MRATLFLTVVVSIVFAAQIEAGIETRTDFIAVTTADTISGGPYVRATLPVISASRGSKIAYAELLFKAKLPVGTEVELVSVTDDETPSWDAVLEAGEQRLWTVDTTTGTTIRFDVTDLVRTGVAERKAVSVLIRAIDPQNEIAITLPVASDLTMKLHRDP